MKILLPYISRSGHNIDSKVIGGGIEKFSQNLYRLFPNEIIPVEITRENRENRQTKEIFLNSVKSIKPDIILINDIDIYFTLPQIEWNIPTVQVIHEPLMRDIRYLTLWKNMNKFISAGGHLYFVSKNQYEFIDENVKRITGEKIKNIHGFINTSYSSGNEQVNLTKEYDTVTIGRTDILKDPFFIHRKELFKSCVLTDKGDFQHSEKQKQYTLKNMDWKPPQYTFRGLDYDNTMLELSKGKVYISTCPVESWGITVLEALIRGIPCLLLTDKGGNHSSENIPSLSEHIIKIQKTAKVNDIKNAINTLANISDEKRIDISNLTKSKHSFDNFKNQFINIFQKRLNDKHETNNLMSLI